MLRRFLFEPGGVVEHETGHGEEGEGGEDECADDPVGKAHQAPEGLLHGRRGERKERQEYGKCGCFASGFLYLHTILRKARL